jgi:hypothetical protein
MSTTEKFYTILTDVGKAKIANAAGLGTQINFATMKVGDGGGAYYTPVESQTDLVNTVWTGNITQVSIDEDNSNWINIEVLIPPEDGGFFIREYGIFDSSGNMLAVAKCAETYKPLPADGGTKEITVKMILAVSNTSSITLKIDPTVIFAKKSEVETVQTQVTTIATEIQNARGTYENLEERLDHGDTQLSDMVNNFANAKNPIVTPTYDGSYQAVHPKVLYFPDGWGSGSYRYWMAMTPYTDTHDAFENPSILVSNNGREFIIPNGLVNPIDKPTDEDITGGAHMSDPHIVTVGNTMELWYRYNAGNGDGTPNNNIELIYKKKSTDGITWSDATLVFDKSGVQFLSPAIIYEDSKYKIWYISHDDMYYIESTDGITWTTPIICSISRGDYSLWHVDVIKTDLGYETVISIYETQIGLSGFMYLLYANSTDGIMWNNIRIILSPSQETIFWDNQQIYRSSILKIDNLYKIYYSAMSSAKQWHIGLTQGYSLSTLRGYDLATFYENLSLFKNLMLVDDKILSVGGVDNKVNVSKEGLTFQDDPSSFTRNLLSLVNKGVAGAKLTVESYLDTVVIKNDANTNYGNLMVSGLALMHSIPALSVEGSLIYNATLKTLQVRDESSFRTIAQITSGLSTNRPINITVGTQYFDTTLGKPIWLKTTPSTWVDATGTIV